MNISPLLGLSIGVAAISYAIFGEMKNPNILLSAHGIVIVIGGTLAAAVICFPIQHFFNLFKVYLRALTGKGRQELITTVNEIIEISKALNNGETIDTKLSQVKNEFLKESLELLEQGGLSDTELDDVLEKRVALQNEKYQRDGQTFKIIGKFPPAFGLIGATMGMISLLQSLGEPNAFDRLGPSMSIALVATFYGLVLANIFLIPIGENLNQASEDDLLIRRVVVDGVRLLKEQKHPLLVEEYLKSYLPPADRNRIAKAVS